MNFFDPRFCLLSQYTWHWSKHLAHTEIQETSLELTEETSEMSFTDLRGRDVPCASIFTKFSALTLSWLLLMIHLLLSFLSRIFRKKKRIRRSLSSLFNLSTSESWLHGSIFGNADSSANEDVWLEGVRRLETNHCNENGEFEPLFPWWNFQMGSSSHVVLDQCKIQRRQSFWCRGWTTF